MLRESKNYTKTEVAKKLSMAYSTYNHYEIGDREPNSIVLKQLSEIFDTTIDFILLGKQSTAPTPLITNDEQHLLNLYRNSTDTAKGMAIGVLMSHQKENHAKKRA
jgi:transcriptional regulator with XRE-family HTH domain